ncbi:MAG: OmpA family protein, partial [Thermodesulfovibrionales bacterium]|nr:OmpA family protein [Thermodesulfovibrionales bacterium]
MKKLLLLIMIVSVLGLFGCAQRSFVSGPDTVAPTTQEPTDSTGAPTDAGRIGPDGEVISEDLGTDTGAAVSPVGIGREISDVEFSDIHFDFDKYDIKPEYRPVLMEISDWLIRNEAVALIEGHCDERGTNEYNLALGDRRAKATRDFLMASGVPSRKIEYISYGEERPLCT